MCTSVEDPKSLYSSKSYSKYFLNPNIFKYVFFKYNRQKREREYIVEGNCNNYFLINYNKLLLST